MVFEVALLTASKVSGSVNDVVDPEELITC
jgi:hypothetical protein